MSMKKDFLQHQCLLCSSGQFGWSFPQLPLPAIFFFKSRSLCCPSLESSLDITFKVSVKLKPSPRSPLTPQKYFTLEVSSWSPSNSRSPLHHEENAV